MKKNIILLATFILYFNSIKTEVLDCSGFETAKQTRCSNLNNLLAGQLCYYDGKDCKDWYDDCEDYTPTSESDTICAKIIPKSSISGNIYKKCAIKKDNTGKLSCTTIFKECKDLTETECLSYTYSDLSLGDDERCVWVNKKCELHYNQCTNSNIQNNDLCNNNIPKKGATKCIWKNESCQPENRKCSDYIEYSANGEININCESLEHTDKKICFFDNFKCNEVYKTCEDYTSGDKTITCENIKPLEVNNFGSYQRDTTHKCVTETSGCKIKEKTCRDFNIEEDSESLCPLLKSEKDPTGSKALCILQEDSCKDTYLNCEYYNDLITEERRNNDDCTSIPAKSTNPSLYEDEHYKCSYNVDNDKKCKTKLKTCSEITDEDICNSHPLDDNEQKCVYKNGECIKEFKNCDIYNSHHSADKSKIDKNVCEAITPIYDYPDNVKKYQCVYKEENSGKSCEKKEMKCEDYKGQDKDICSSISPNVNDTSLYKCALVDNHCETQYIDCNVYENHIQNNNKPLYKSLCESIVLTDSNYRCFVENDKTCERKKKLCSEYEGKSENICSNNYRAADTGKTCTMENGKCVEKYPIQNYIYCSDYRGTNREFCESIQPHIYSSSHSRNIPDYSSRCIYGNKGCEKVSKKCEEAKDYDECQSIIPSNTNKMCVFKHSCFEQYKDCLKYENGEDSLNQDTCESILIQGKPETHRCKYNAGAGTSKGTCRETERKCTDLIIESIIGDCSSISLTLTDQTKKCVFSNNACSLVSKTCLELFYLSGADDEECGAAVTSSQNKKCVVNSNNDGCIEIDKDSNGGNENQGGGDSSGNSLIEKNYFIKIAIILLGLLA